ncbi:MAG: SDR family oxidoreductase [Spirochaetales bacterium]|nr:SDR family oxidoreductase [Spirochaetales bacterium]
MKKIREKYGPWALITGASAGIGKAFAERLAEEGLNLVLAARRKKELLEQKKLLEKKYSIEVCVVPVDLTAAKAVSGLLKKIGKREVGLLINNAGFGLNRMFAETDPAIDETMITLNCQVPVALTHLIVPQMIKRKKGGIINLSSIAANQATPANCVYAATKVFDLFFSEALAFELKPFHIDVLAVLPGATATEFQQIAGYEVEKGLRRPEDVVNSALRTLGKRLSVTDGAVNKIMTFFARRILPRKWAASAAYAYTRAHAPKDAE